MPAKTPNIVLCSGEPGGIGPDIVLKSCAQSFPASIAVIGDLGVFRDRNKLLGTEINIVEIGQGEELQAHKNGEIRLIHQPLSSTVHAGELNPRNSGYVLSCIDKAVDLCLDGQCDAMVTAPVHKGIINDAGIAFTGHTEWIARRCDTEQPVMMLASETMKVCLATTHIPIREVSDAITQSRLTVILDTILNDLCRLYAVENPRIAVCGLNPHAGENGHLGSEEIDTISPVVQQFQASGYDVIGPVPADTVFTVDRLQHLDCVLAMFHDQGLPVIKHNGFGDIVNITLGLPIIRTSVDHGTALDLAGTGIASESSLVYAINKAIQFSNNRKANS